MNKAKVPQSPTRVSLTVTEALLGKFCLLTGGGFTIHPRIGCTLRGLLCRDLGVKPGYVDDRIQTILLNGKVVDDPDAAIVTAGSTVALSAAMPGIAGAMLRKSGYYAPMRSELSCDQGEEGSAADVEGDVVVKLFNLLQQELGPGLLRRGIQIPGPALGELLRRRPAAFRSGILTAEVEGKPVAPGRLADMEWAQGEIFLVVRPAPRDVG
jgi:hypothetical protein